MATVNAYTVSKMDELLNDTVQSASITGAKPNQYLRLVMDDGSVQNIGPITGAQGPIGQEGSGLGEVQTALASIIPTPWSNMPIDATILETTSFSSYNYAPFRYRVIGDVVEFSGSCSYTGASGITTFQVCPFGALPADMYITTGTQYRVMTAQRYSVSGAFYDFPIYVAANGSFTLFQYSGPDQPQMQPGDYLNFNGCSYHK